MNLGMEVSNLARN